MLCRSHTFLYFNLKFPIITGLTITLSHSHNLTSKLKHKDSSLQPNRILQSIQIQFFIYHVFYSSFDPSSNSSRIKNRDNQGTILTSIIGCKLPEPYNVLKTTTKSKNWIDLFKKLKIMYQYLKILQQWHQKLVQGLSYIQAHMVWQVI